MTITCSNCQQVFKTSAGLTSHLRVCGKRPTKKALSNMVAQGLTLAEMAEELGTHSANVRQWLAEVGMGDYRFGSNIKRRQHNSESLDLLPQFAPYRGKTGGCDRCEARPRCQQRILDDVWVLCEAPTPEEVYVAVVNDLILIGETEESIRALDG